jgi:transposase-like protein
MKCPRCNSTQISKNGRRNGKQNYFCKQCKRQFLEFYASKGYSDDVKIICLRMHKNGMGFREIERVTGVNHNTIIQWAKQLGNTTSETSSSNALEDDNLGDSSESQAHIECENSFCDQNSPREYSLKNNSTTQFKSKLIFDLWCIKIFRINYFNLSVFNLNFLNTIELPIVMNSLCRSKLKVLDSIRREFQDIGHYSLPL